jgi:4a-hydroxytetrahydrobiopterin dehydratase
MANKVLTHRELEQALNSLPGWSAEDGRLVASVECADFPAAVALVIRVALLAEKADHHPDEMNLMWRTVRFALVTHSAKGITAKDLELARTIQALAG